MSMFNVDTSTLDDVASKIRAITNSMDAQKNMVNNIGQRTQEAWQSDATATFVDSLNTVKGKLDKNVIALRELAVWLNNTADVVRQKEREIQEQIERERIAQVAREKQNLK